MGDPGFACTTSGDGAEEGHRMSDPDSQKSFVALAMRPATVSRSLKVAVFVGSVLGAINHYDMFISGNFEAHRVVQLLVTYVVPYAVATYGSVTEARDC